MFSATLARFQVPGSSRPLGCRFRRSSTTPATGIRPKQLPKSSKVSRSSGSGLSCASTGSKSRIRLEPNLPVGLRRFLRAHDVSTAYRMGWSDLSNSELLRAAEAAGFELLISCDQNLVHQQTLTGLRIAVLVLGTNRWALLRDRGADIERAV